jgi:O-antigen/teichoic acid export membrane protein
MLVLSVLRAFSKTGFEEALVQRKEASPYHDVAWTMRVVRGIVIFAVMMALSPAIARLFREPMAAPLLRVLALTVLVDGVHNIGAVLLLRNLQFPRYVAYVSSMRITDFVTTIAAAWVMRNAWPFVLGSVAGALAGLVASFVLHPYRPRLELDRAKAGHLFGFGRWVLASSGLFYFFTHIDDFFVARFLGASSLGFYQMAYTISNLPANVVTAASSQVMFPAFSRLQDSTQEIGSAFVRVIQVVVFISAPLAGAIFFFSPDFTRLFLGDKWLPMLSALQLLALWGGMRSYSKIAGTVLYAVGRPDILTKLNLAKLLLLAALLWPLTARWGIAGTALAVVLSVAPVDPLFQYAVIKQTGLHSWSVGRAIVLPVVNTVAVLAVLGVCRLSVFRSPSLPGLVFLAVAGSLLYLALAHLCDEYLGYGIRPTIVDILKTL